MKAPLSWLKDFVDINVDVAELCSKLVSIGFEVEEVKFLGDNIENVVVGQILSIVKHTNADKLSICEVDVGKKRVQIITGAKNVKVNDKIPVALDGALLPTGKIIKSGELRGVLSDGMLCSGDELCVDDNVYPGASVDGILILDSSERTGANIVDILGLNDYVLDICIMANRPDCNSIVGIAREIAVALNTKFRQPEIDFKPEPDGNIHSLVSARVQDKDLCPSYLLAAVTNVKIAPSPIWLTRRLNAVGLRGINNMVDITNYVLTEIGQPMHAFDCDKIKDKTIIVRRAKQNEKLTLLNENEYALTDSMLVIADKNSAVGIAGIMGGKDSGIKNETNAIVFESATFTKESIRKTGRKLAVRSDSSARFEKGVDTYTNYLGLKRALHLVDKLGCGKIASGLIEIVENPIADRTLQLNYSRIGKLLGTTIPKKNVIEILKLLQIDAAFKGETLTCVIPPYRGDIERDCDVIEELIRIWGYDNITSTLLAEVEVTKGGKSGRRQKVDLVKDLLRGFGLNEIITFAFENANINEKLILNVGKQIRIENPLSEELSAMRTTLAGEMINVIKRNINRKHLELSLFECGKVFVAKELPLIDLPEEVTMLCVGLSGAKADFYTIKDIISNIVGEFNLEMHIENGNAEYLHPNISAAIYIENQLIGNVGKVHPVVCNNFELNQNIYLAEINLDKLIELSEEKTVVYRQISKYPAIKRDLALVVDERIAVGKMIDVVKKACSTCEEVKLFDVYVGAQVEAGKKSVALTLTFRTERTLRDEEVDVQVQFALEALKKSFGAILRRDE